MVNISKYTKHGYYVSCQNTYSSWQMLMLYTEPQHVDWLKVVKIILTEIPTNQYTSEACGKSEKSKFASTTDFCCSIQGEHKYTIFLRVSRILQGNKNPWNIKVPSKRSFLLINPWIPTHFWSEIQALKPTQSWSLKSAQKHPGRQIKSDFEKQWTTTWSFPN